MADQPSAVAIAAAPRVWPNSTIVTVTLSLLGSILASSGLIYAWGGQVAVTQEQIRTLTRSLDEERRERVESVNRLAATGASNRLELAQRLSEADIRLRADVEELKRSRDEDRRDAALSNRLLARIEARIEGLQQQLTQPANPSRRNSSDTPSVPPRLLEASR